MKIIHTGDIHIGSTFRALPSEKARLRRAELLDGFFSLCAYAKAENVGAVLVAGDLFDSHQVSTQTVEAVFSAIRGASPVPFFYVSGNHDERMDLPSALPENFYVFSKNRGFAYYPLTEKITVAGMDARDFSTDNFCALSLDENNFNILLLHGDLQKDIPLELLKNKGVDYLALGHIHIPDGEAKRLDGRGKYRYCGCLEGRGFDELGARGFFLLDVQERRVVSERFLSFSKRRVLEKAVDISACKSYFDVENAALAALANENRESIVKLVLTGRFCEGLKKDVPLLTQRLAEQFFFVKVEDNSRLQIDFRVYQNDLTERGEFVRAVGRYEMSEDLRLEILEVGLKALAGEEIDL